MSSSSNYLVLAVDLGGTTVEVGLVESLGAVLGRRTLRTCDFRQPEDFVRELARQRQSLEQETGRLAEMVGVGAPSGRHQTGTVESAFNLKWGQRIPLAKLLEQTLGLFVALDNDANVAALGVRHFGAHRGHDNFVVVTLGTGVGAGLFAEGRLVRGAGGLAGEFGHMTAERGGRLCGCGRQGCLETYVSSAGISRTFAEMATARGQQVEALSSEQIYAKALTGDRLALDTFDCSGRRFAGPLVDLVLLLAPNLILFTGGVAQAGAVFQEPIGRHFKAELGGCSTACRLAFCPETSMALRGAAVLAVKSFACASARNKSEW